MYSNRFLQTIRKKKVLFGRGVPHELHIITVHQLNDFDINFSMHRCTRT